MRPLLYSLKHNEFRTIKTVLFTVVILQLEDVDFFWKLKATMLYQKE